MARSREENTEAGDKIMTAAKEGLLSGLSDDDLKNRFGIYVLCCIKSSFYESKSILPIDDRRTCI